MRIELTTRDTFRAAVPEERLRVLVISHTSQSRAAGQARFVPLARRPDVDCSILVPDRWREYGAWKFAEPSAHRALEVIVGHIVWPWSGPAQWYLHWYPRVWSLMRDYRPDIVHIWEEPWSLICAQATWIRNRDLNATRVVLETEQNIDKTLPFPFERFRSYTLRHADFVFGRSAEAIGVLRSKGYSGPAAILPYGVDLELFKSTDRQKEREALGLSGFVVGYVGRFVPEKGLEDLLDALSMLPLHVSLALLGTGPLRSPLAEKAQLIGIADRIRFVEPRPAGELAGFLSALDVLVLPSRTTARWKEQFGRVIIEAHACRLPVIGSRSGAIPQVVGRGGIIVPEQDPRSLAQSIRDLERSPARVAELGRLGRAQVEADYTWEKVAARLYKVYRSVQRRPPP